MKPRSLYDDFLNSRVAANCSPNTVTWYRYHFKRLDIWLAANQKTVLALTPLDVETFLAWLRENKYSPTTVAQAHGALVTLFRWAINMEITTTNPAAKIKRPKIPEYIPPIQAREYVAHMLDRIKLNTWMDYRDKLIIHLLFCTGIRAGECAALKVAHLQFEHRIMHITGKGGHQRLIPYPEELAIPLWQWVNVQRPVCEYPELFLASTRSGGVKGPVSAQTIYWIAKRRAAEAAVDFKSPHAYRHGFAVDMLINGASTRLIQLLLGHADIKTTERYLSLAPQLIQGMFDEIWDQNPLR